MRAPSADTSWSPLPRALEHFLQSHCTIPTLTPLSLFKHAPFLAAQVVMAKVPGGASTALFSGVAGVFACASAVLPMLGVKVTTTSLLGAAALGVAALSAVSAAMTLLLLVFGMRSFLPYGSRSASCILRSPHALWFAYASLDGRHGGVAAEHSRAAGDLNEEVKQEYVWSAASGSSAQYVLHQDKWGAVHLMDAGASQHSAALSRAKELSHSQRSVRIGDQQWLLFACCPPNAGGS